MELDRCLDVETDKIHGYAYSIYVYHVWGCFKKCIIIKLKSKLILMQKKKKICEDSAYFDLQTFMENEDSEKTMLRCQSVATKIMLFST